jgi:RsiW-degrading membrane proteinase PrsW (M82 family)
MFSIIALSLAPVLIILLYLYSRDKYEREPIGVLLKAIFGGIVIVLPVVLIELWLSNMAIVFFPKSLREVGVSEIEFIGNSEQLLAYNAYKGFVVAAFTEEIFKYAIFFLLIWKNKNFNEHFDGIIYAAFISLGFAAVENIFYVVDMGEGTGILRAFTAVPGHALFGVAMGYYLAMAKFSKKGKNVNLAMALIIPIILHGTYDFILFSGKTLILLLFIPFVIYLWILGFKRMKQHSDSSVFNPQNVNVDDDDEA